MSDETPDTEESEAKAPDSRIVDMASMILSGEIFGATTEDGETDVEVIKEFHAQFTRFLVGLKGVGKVWDAQLIQLRNVHGDDFLPGVGFHRKPRAKAAGGNSLLDNLRL